MAFVKYNIENDVIAQFDIGVSASTTTINLKVGEGTQFPTTNGIIKFVQYNTPADTTSGVAKSENVLITGKSGDVLTVTRGFGGDTPTTFLADDYIYLTNHKAVIEDIQDEVTRLETDKLNLGALRTGLTNIWKMFFSNGTNAETELALGANGTYLKSNGTATAPSWGTPPLDVNGQTTITTIDRANDYVAISDGSDSNNTKKVAIEKIADSATTSQEGLAETCTDAEAIARTDTSRYMTPANYTAANKDAIQSSTSKSLSTNYQATENGFLHGWVQRNNTLGGISAKVYSDATATPTTLINTGHGDGGLSYAGFCAPVKKDNYYRVDYSGTLNTAAIYFTPLN